MVKDMAGAQPQELCLLREFLKVVKERQIKNRKIQKGPSAILFHGPAGTGKTLGVKNMSQEADVHLDFQDIKALISEHGGNLSGELKKIYATAVEKSKNEKRPIIILFDDTSTKGDMGNMLLLLNTILDSNFDNPSVITIFTSNSDLSSFDNSLKNRCLLVSLQMPDTDKRIEIIKFYNQRFDGTVCNEAAEKLAKKYSDFSCRDIALVFEKAQLFTTNNGGVLLMEHVEKAFADMQAIKDAEKRSVWTKMWLVLTWPFRWN